jgi:hypothetical protein
LTGNSLILKLFFIKLLLLTKSVLYLYPFDDCLEKWVINDEFSYDCWTVNEAFLCSNDPASIFLDRSFFTTCFVTIFIAPVNAFCPYILDAAPFIISILSTTHRWI